jgi:hypothetical protein
MLQFYFLSILLNAVTAFVLMYGDIEDQAGESRLPRIVLDETFRLVLGILTAVTGFFKLLTAIRGDIPVIGDLVPAAAGLAGGFALLYEFYRARSVLDESKVPPFLIEIVSAKRYVAIACLISAVTHFLFPTVIFL